MAVRDDDPTGAGTSTGGQRPAGAGRLVKVFDFEEREFNAEPVPRGWVRAQHSPPVRERPGFPIWNAAKFDDTVARSGRTSVLLPASGGSTSLRLGPTAAAIFPDADLEVTAWIRTAGLSGARAVLAARMMDQRGEPIAGTESQSQPISSPGVWSKVSVRMLPSPSEAAFVQVELMLLQAERLPGGRQGSGAAMAALNGALADGKVYVEDLEAQAWFDDVSILQVPRVSVSVTGGALVLEPASPELRLTVRDLTGEKLSTELLLRDLDGVEVERRQWEMNAGGGQVVFSPALPRLGWYRADVTVTAPSGPVGSSWTTLLWGPALTEAQQRAALAGQPMSGLAIRLDSLERSATRPIAELAAASGAGLLTVPISAFIEPEESPGSKEGIAAFDRLVKVLSAARMDLRLDLDSVPPALAAGLPIAADHPVALGDKAPALWGSWLSPLLDAFGQRAIAWTVGRRPVDGTLPATPSAAGAASTVAATAGAPAPSAPASAVAKLAGLRAGLSRLTAAPSFHELWRSEWGPSLSGPDAPEYSGVEVALPIGLPPAALSGVAAGMPALPGMLLLESVDPQTFGQREALADFMQRAVYVLAGASNGAGGTPSLLPGGVRPGVWLGVLPPWERVSGSLQQADSFVPSARMAGMRALARHLADRRVADELPIGEGLRAFVLDSAVSSMGGGNRNGNSALVAWNERAGPGAELVGYLGRERVKVVDVFGNAREALADAEGLFRIPLNDLPVFIEGVEANLGRFVASFAVTPPFIPAVATVHEREVTLANPFPYRISGTVQLLGEPSRRSRWTIQPTTPIAFSISPGETHRFPFAFSFPASEESVQRMFTAVVRLEQSGSGGMAFPPLRVSAPIRIGLEDLDLQAFASTGPAVLGPDVVVTATVTNSGRTSRTLQVEAGGAGQATQSQSISNLGPGETVTRRFVFAGQAEALAGRAIRVTVSDVDRAEKLNRFAPVP